MPEVITVTKETTVYTLAELEALNWSVYEHAIGKVIEWGWEGFEPSNLTEDLVYNLAENFPLFELHQTTERYASGKERKRPYLYWDMNPLSCEAKGDIDIREYMKAEKLCNKFRALWYAVDTLGCNETIGVSFGNGQEVDLYDLQRQIDYEDSIAQPSARYDLICKQVEALEGDIQNYVDGVQSAIIKQLRAEEDYLSSTQFAKDEAEAMEFRFTEDGDIYHG